MDDQEKKEVIKATVTRDIVSAAKEKAKAKGISFSALVEMGIRSLLEETNGK